MRVIGITGPTGAGKTTVLQALESLGGVLIDADAVYHDLTRSSQAMQAELIARFGPVYDGNELDRKKLGAVVFQDEKALADLNRITGRPSAASRRRRPPGPPPWALTPLASWRASWSIFATAPWPSPPRRSCA